MMRHPGGSRAARCALVIVLGASVVLAACSSSDDGAEKDKETATTTAPKPAAAAPTDPGTATEVPDLGSKTASEAAQELRDRGFENIVAVDATGDQRTVDVDAEWVVVGQSLPPGSSAGSNEPTTIFVTKPGETPKPPEKLGYVQAPDLLYQPVKDGVASLNKAGIFDVVGTDFSGQGRLIEVDKPWTVLSQNPVAGAWVEPSVHFTFAALPASEAPKHAG